MDTIIAALMALTATALPCYGASLGVSKEQLKASQPPTRYLGGTADPATQPTDGSTLTGSFVYHDDTHDAVHVVLPLKTFISREACQAFAAAQDNIDAARTHHDMTLDCQ